MKTKAVIFDLDGTLIHTKPEYIEQLLRKCFTETGIEPTKENIEKLWYGPLKDKFLQSKGVSTEEFWKKFIEYDTIESREKYIEPYADSFILKPLSENGIKLGVVTNNNFHAAEHEINLLRPHGIQFDAIIVAFDSNSNMIVKPKPDPDGIFQCLEIFGAEKEEAIFVGNSQDDIDAAKAAGVLDVFIDREEHLIPVEATITIKSLQELLRIIQ